MVLGDKECFVSATSLTVCKCTKEEHEKVPDIHFKINDDEYTIPRDMWYERGGAQGHSCVVKFMHGPHKENWVMGLNFYTRYYAVFDYENKRVGLAESVLKDAPSSKFFINWATTGLQDLQGIVDSVRNHREYFIYGCLAMFLTSVVALCYSFSSKKKA